MDRDTSALGNVPSSESRILEVQNRKDDSPYQQTLLAFSIEAAKLLQDRHCEDIVLFDVRNICQITDYILIASGTSNRQIKAVADELKEVAQTHDLDRLGIDVDADAAWLVVDFVDVVVHLFDPPTRAHYDLEMLWNDAPRVKVPGQHPR